MWNKFKEKIANPFYQGLLAIIGLSITLYLIFNGERGQIPLYSIEESRIIASSPSNKLKLLWDTTPLNNVKLTRIAIWNGGDKYIDKFNFSTTYPITISSIEKCRILEVKAIQRSRNTLKILPRLIDNKIFLAIQGDDGLEAKDGVIYQIMFTSEGNIHWKIDGRVKNVPNGIIEVDWKKASDRSFFSGRIDIIGTIFLVIINVLNFKNFVKSFKESKHTSRKMMYIIILLIIFTTGSYTVSQLYNDLVSVSQYKFPVWAKI